MEAESDAEKYFSQMKKFATEDGTADLFSSISNYDGNVVRETLNEFCEIPKKKKTGSRFKKSKKEEKPFEEVE